VSVGVQLAGVGTVAIMQTDAQTGRRALRVVLVCASAAAALLAAACGPAGGTAQGVPSAPAAVPPGRAAAPAVWFQPASTYPPTPDGPFGQAGSTDYEALFNRVVSWPLVLAHTKVMGFSVPWLLAVSDQTLRRAVRFLNAHAVLIEVEAPALQATRACGSGIEGYVPAGLSVRTVTLYYLRRLKALGGRVAFINLDEPYYYGTVTNEPGACHFPVATTAREVARFAALVATIYPRAQVGDVEPLEPVLPGSYAPDAVAAIGRWHAAYRLAAGRGFPYFFADNDFDDPAWVATAMKMERLAHQERSQFGMIYTGDAQDQTDAQWAAQTVQRARAFAAANHGQADYVLFESWETHPRHVLPETDPTTFTGAIAAYLAGGTG
jgi:hypothetical protein